MPRFFIPSSLSFRGTRNLKASLLTSYDALRFLVPRNDKKQKSRIRRGFLPEKADYTQHGCNDYARSCYQLHLLNGCLLYANGCIRPGEHQYVSHRAKPVEDDGTNGQADNQYGYCPRLFSQTQQSEFGCFQENGYVQG